MNIADYLVVTQKDDNPEHNKYNAKRHLKSVYIILNL